MSFAPIKDGEFTSTIYGMASLNIKSALFSHFKIRDNRFMDVMRVLQIELQRIPNVSLLCF